MQESVKQDRHLFVGGSDIGIIMGLSPFKTRWQLLQEKAGIVPIEEVDNIYTRYGNEMEGVIRDHLNNELEALRSDPFIEGKHIAKFWLDSLADVIDIRVHTDGENRNCVFECKTCGEGYDLMLYKVQTIFNCFIAKKDHALIAIYHRPEDMSMEFDPERLELIAFTMRDDEPIELLPKIRSAVEKFISDLKALKENPFLSEEDLIPTELVEVANKVLSFEQRLAEIKAEEEYIEKQKENLFKAMVSANVKKWVTLNGTQITRVDPIATEHYTADEFDESRFKADNPELYNKYLVSKEKKKSGRKGYVKITLPGGKEK